MSSTFQPEVPSSLPFAWQAELGKNGGWRVFATLVVVIATSLLGNLPLVAVLATSDPVRQRGLDVSNFTPEALGVDPTLFLFLLLLPFVLGLLALWQCVKRIHERDPVTLIQGKLGRVRWRRVWLAFGTWMVLSAAAEGVSFWLNADVYAFSFSAWAFAKTLFVVVLMIPLQIAFEELMMRGYVLQLTTYYTRRPWMGLLLSTIIFGALHFQNPEVQRFGLAMTAPYYLGVGFFLGLLTILDDGLELALGIHLATNVFGSLVVNFKGSALPTSSLFLASDINLLLMSTFFVVQALVFFLLFRRKESDKVLQMKWFMSSLNAKAPY